MKSIPCSSRLDLEVEASLITQKVTIAKSIESCQPARNAFETFWRCITPVPLLTDHCAIGRNPFHDTKKSYSWLVSVAEFVVGNRNLRFPLSDGFLYISDAFGILCCIFFPCFWAWLEQRDEIRIYKRPKVELDVETLLHREKCIQASAKLL